MSKPKKHYFMIEYISEIVDAETKEEAVAIAKQRVQDRDVEVDEENTCQVEEDLLKEIEEDQKRADKQEAKTTAKPKKQ